MNDEEQDNFVLNDEGIVNSHGFILLNSAGRFERFNSNPVMLFNHDSAALIGQMKGLKIEGTKLIGTAEYDEEDPLALKCKRQSKSGILKGCSPGIIINAIEMRTNPSGEEQCAVTDWELCEVSLVSVPSNQNALKLYNSNMQPISDEDIKLSINNLLNNKNVKMDKLILTVEAYQALGLSSEADNKAVSAAIMELTARLKTAEEKIESERKFKAEALVNLAVTDGRITADKKEAFVKMALADYETAKTTLEAIPEKMSLSNQLVNKPENTGREDWTYLKWAKEDPVGLKKMKAEDPEAFAELKKRIK